MIHACTCVTEKVYLILILSLEVTSFAFLFSCVLRQLVLQFLQTLHRGVSGAVQQNRGRLPLCGLRSLGAFVMLTVDGPLVGVLQASPKLLCMTRGDRLQMETSGVSTVFSLPLSDQYICFELFGGWRWRYAWDSGSLSATRTWPAFGTCLARAERDITHSEQACLLPAWGQPLPGTLCWERAPGCAHWAVGGGFCGILA